MRTTQEYTIYIWEHFDCESMESMFFPMCIVLLSMSGSRLMAPPGDGGIIPPKPQSLQSSMKKLTTVPASVGEDSRGESTL